MRVSFKKTLATVLSVALVLSTCLCALTVGAAATVAGRIDIFDNVNINSSDSTFEVSSNITLDTASEFVEVALTLNLPDGFTLNSAVAEEPSIADVSVDANKVITVSARGPVTSIALVMTIAKTVSEFDAFDLGVAKLEFADVSEADLTLDITDTGRISLYVEHGASDAYAFDDNNHWNTCVAEGCTEKYNLADHTWVAGEKVDATCTTAGSQAYSCVCGATKTEEIAALDHVAGEPVKEKEVLPTCTTEGSYDMVTYCTVCEEELNRVSTTVPTTDHTPLAAVKENEVTATCAAAGSYDMVVRCAECNEIISTEHFEVEALEHEYQYADNGDGNHTKTCKNCDTVNEVEAHTYVDGTCACGAKEGPDIDPALVVAGASIVFEKDCVAQNFRIRNSVLTSYDDVKLAITYQHYNETTKNLDPAIEKLVSYSDFEGTGTFRTYKHRDIMLYELALDIQYQLRAYDGDKVIAQSEVFTTSPVAYLKATIPSFLTSQPKFVTLATDLIVLCEKARIQYAVAESHLERDSKITLLDDIDLDNATQSTDVDNKTNLVTPYSDSWGDKDSVKTHRVMSSAVIQKVPGINLRITGGKSLDLSKLSVNISYTSDNTEVGTNGVFSQTYTSANGLKLSGSFVTLAFEEIGLQDNNKTITYTISYDDGVAGNDDTVCKWEYSIETYLNDNLSGNLSEVASALIKLGKSCRDYFL